LTWALPLKGEEVWIGIWVKLRKSGFQDEAMERKQSHGEQGLAKEARA
jgi:hypothetical protein